jgi:CRISPR type III-A-associated RAMP protein Csm4
MEFNKSKLYKLSFTTPLHISNERGDYSSGNAVIQSDTLYAAICWAWNALGKQEWINDLPNSSFGISSCFPYNGRTLFFPRPRFTYEYDKDLLQDTVIRKKIKKAEWVDLPILQEMLAGKDPGFYKKENFQNNFWSSSLLDSDAFMQSAVVPRVMVPRDGQSDTTIFYIEKHFFQKDAGLYFLAMFTTDIIQQRVEAALSFLADEGLGTDRNVGHGKFEWKVSELTSLAIQNKFNLCYNLGLFIPESKKSIQELFASSKKGYEIIKRGGWLSEPYQTWRKKQVYMFKEGSVFSSPNQRNMFLMGATVDLKPSSVQPAIQHPVWRCGRTIFINF